MEEDVSEESKWAIKELERIGFAIRDERGFALKLEVKDEILDQMEKLYLEAKRRGALEQDKYKKDWFDRIVNSAIVVVLAENRSYDKEKLKLLIYLVKWSAGFEHEDIRKELQEHLENLPEEK